MSMPCVAVILAVPPALPRFHSFQRIGPPFFSEFFSCSLLGSCKPISMCKGFVGSLAEAMQKCFGTALCRADRQLLPRPAPRFNCTPALLIT